MQTDNIGAIIISVIATVAFAGVLLIWVMKPPSVNSDVLNVLVGALSAGYLQTLAYWFGSSSGSKEKDKTIAKIATPNIP